MIDVIRNDLRGGKIRLPFCGDFTGGEILQVIDISLKRFNYLSKEIYIS